MEEKLNGKTIMVTGGTGLFAAVNNFDNLNYFKHFIDILAYKVL